MSRKSIFVALFVVLAALALAACAGEPVVETVIVTQIVEGEVVEVVVTAAPEVVEEGPRTLVICTGQEPDSLYPYATDMLAASQVQAAFYDGPVDTRTYAYQPIIWDKLPSLADGDAAITVVDVVEGDLVVDNVGEVSALTAHTTAVVNEGGAALLADGSLGVLHAAGAPVLDDAGAPVFGADGVTPEAYAAAGTEGAAYIATTYRPAGCNAADCAVEYTGGDVEVDVLGTFYRPSGCNAADCAVEYTGGTVQMDQLSATFALKAGLVWSDGTPLTTADEIYAFNLAADPDNSSSKYLTDRTASFVAVDDLVTTWTGLPGYMDSTYFLNNYGPYPQHLWGQYTAADLLTEVDAQEMYLGWGPFIFDEWVKGDHISMHANPNYFRAAEGLPKFENLVYRFIGEDPNTGIAAILSGECDIIDQTLGLESQSELLLELQAAGQINPTFITGTVWEHADFLFRPVESYLSRDAAVTPGGFSGWDLDGDGVGPFGDIRLRQAVAQCMDRQAVVDTVYYGQSITIDTYIPPEHPLFNPENVSWPYDPAAAGLLLDEIGWLDDDGVPETPRVASGVLGVPDGTLLEFRYETTSAAARMAATQIMAESALACGIQMDLGYFPAGEWFADGPDGPLYGRHYDLGQFAWLTGVDPACNLYLSSEIPTAENAWAGQNNPAYVNEEYDVICRAAIQALPGQDAYTANHLEAQRIFSEELPVVPLYLRLKLAATRPDMCNFYMDPTNNSEMWNVEEFDYGAGCGE